MSLSCSNCGAETRIIDSRQIEDHIRRRCKCLGCGRRFSTKEFEWDKSKAGQDSAIAKAGQLMRLNDHLMEMSASILAQREEILRPYREAECE